MGIRLLKKAFLSFVIPAGNLLLSLKINLKRLAPLDASLEHWSLAD
jgi:hypothetical protein